jgi:glycosyltransferase involved in cell wall biosynthesis
MTSKWEGLGNVIIEAMNCGVPCVLYDVLGVRDTLPDGKGGLLVDTNPEALASAVTRLIVDQDLCKKLAIEARANVQKNFDAGASVRALVDLYGGQAPEVG